MQVEFDASVKLDKPNSHINANIKYGGNPLFKLAAEANKKPGGGVVTVDVNTNAPLRVIEGKFVGEVDVGANEKSAKLKFVFNAHNVEVKAVREMWEGNGKQITFDVSGTVVPTTKLNIKYSAARITDSKLELSFDMEKYLTVTWKCGVEGRKISCQGNIKGKKWVQNGRELDFVAVLNLKKSKFHSKISWQGPNQPKEEVKLVIQFNKTDNKLTMKFNSPFAGYEEITLEGTKETTPNGAKFTGTANANNVPSKIVVDYSLKLDSAVKQVDITWKGTRGNKFIDVIFKSKVDLAEHEVEGSIVVTGSEFQEASMNFKGEYGKLLK